MVVGTRRTGEISDEDDPRAPSRPPSSIGAPRGRHLTAEDEASRPFYLKTFWKLTLLMVSLYVFLGSQLDYFVMNSRVLKCYYNEKCEKPFFIPGPPGTSGIQFRAFNNIVSNLGYITFGLTFICIVAWFDPHLYCRVRIRPPGRRRRFRFSSFDEEEEGGGGMCTGYTTGKHTGEGEARRLSIEERYPSSSRGLHEDYSMFYTLGIACVAEGILSAFYHACPSGMTFQLDVTMMFFALGMSVLTFHVKRLPSRGAGPFKAFGSFLTCVVLNFLSHVMGVDVYERPVTAGMFWALAESALALTAGLGIVHVWLTLHLTLNTHGDGLHVSVGQLTWNEQYALLRRSLAPSERAAAVREKTAMAVFLAAEICFLVVMAVAGPVLSLEFFPWALSMEVVTFVLYLCYYVYQKLLSHESIPNWLVVMVMSNLALWLVAFKLYAVKVLDYRLTPAQSEAMNEPCVLWNYFDVHDCWHFVSSAALFLHQLIMFLVDSDLSKTPRKDIAAF